jgi:hypothetical protein
MMHYNVYSIKYQNEKIYEDDMGGEYSTWESAEMNTQS